MGEPDYFSDVDRSKDGAKEHENLTSRIASLYNEWEALHSQSGLC
jgi:hypothetical protein